MHVETISISHGQTHDPDAQDALERVDLAEQDRGSTRLPNATEDNWYGWRPVCDMVCREIARGRIVARYREAIRRGTVAVIVARPDGSALVVFDQGAMCWSPWTAKTVDEARRAAIAVLARGQTYNW